MSEWTAPINEVQERFNRSFREGLAAKQATPAALLGEAREHLRRAETILGRLREMRADAPHLPVMAAEAASNAASWTEDLIVVEREARP